MCSASHRARLQSRLTPSDISPVDAFRQTLLAARSIAYSDSASGVYVANELFARLGIAAQAAPKSRVIPATPVGQIGARGDAEIRLQQITSPAHHPPLRT